METATTTTAAADNIASLIQNIDAGVRVSGDVVYVIPNEPEENAPVAGTLLDAGYSFTAKSAEGCPVLFTITGEPERTTA